MSASDIEGVSSVHLRVRTAAEYRSKFEVHCRQLDIVPQRQDTPLVSHIDCGRWVTPCVCGGGIAATPGWPFAACLDCGRWWKSVVFPSAEDLAAFDAVLSLRPAGAASRLPRRWYSWTPGQTVEDLIAENHRHEWPVPEAP